MRPVSRWTQKCYSKRTYHDKKIARASAKKVSKQLGVKMYAYKCPFCELFHISKTDPEKYRERQRIDNWDKVES